MASWNTVLILCIPREVSFCSLGVLAACLRSLLGSAVAAFLPSMTPFLWAILPGLSTHPSLGKCSHCPHQKTQVGSVQHISVYYPQTLNRTKHRGSDEGTNKKFILPKNKPTITSGFNIAL